MSLLEYSEVSKEIQLNDPEITQTKKGKEVTFQTSRAKFINSVITS